MTAISVIMPVFNTSAYLGQSIESVLAQSFGDFELLCIDDGSTDASASLLEQYAGRDSRVKLFRQPNRGPGAARNAGIGYASGEYLVFWDSDDFFNPKALGLMHAACDQDCADLCVCNSYHYYEDMDFNDPVNASLNQKRLPEKIPFSAREHWGEILNFTNTVAWNKMFRRDYVLAGEFRFGDTKISEDAQFVCPALCSAETISIVNKRLVHYRKARKGSALEGLGVDGQSSIAAWERAYSELVRRDCLPAASFANRIVTTCAFVLGSAGGWQPFLDTLGAIRRIGPDNLGILDGSSGDVYHSEWQARFAGLVREASPEAILFSLMEHYREQSTSTAIGKRKLNQELRRKIKLLSSGK